MRDYARYAGTFWLRGTGRRIRGDKPTQLLAAYLISAPHGTMSGLFQIGLPTVQNETGLDAGEVRHGIERLGQEGFCYFDFEEEVFFVARAVIHQLGVALRANAEGRPDNRSIGLRRELQHIGPHPFVADFWRRYQVSHLLGPWPFPEPRSMPWPAAPTMPLKVSPTATEPLPEAPRAGAPVVNPIAVSDLSDEGREILVALESFPTLATIATTRVARAMADHRATARVGGKPVPPMAHVLGAIAKLATDAAGADWNVEIAVRKLRTYLDRADAGDVGKKTGKINGVPRTNGHAPVAQHAEKAPGELRDPWDYPAEDPRSVESAHKLYGPGTAKAREYEKRHEEARAVTS